MKKMKNELPAESGTESTTEPVDAGRRQALARLGLTAAIAYAAPTLLPLRRALAESGRGSGGGGDSSGGGNGGSDDGSGNPGPGGSEDGSGNPGSGGSDDLDDNSNPTEPTEATSPSE